MIMQYVNLGRSGLKVSRLCLGCMSYGEPERLPQPWSLDESASRPLIRQALEAGQKRRIDVAPQFLADKKIVQSDNTINNFVIVDVKSEFGQAFRHVVLPEMAQSIKLEEGVLAMYAAIDKANPNRWYFYEIYASEEAYQAHRITPHFKEYIEQTAEMTTYKKAIAIKPGLLMNKGGLKYEIE